MEAGRCRVVVAAVVVLALAAWMILFPTIMTVIWKWPPNDAGGFLGAIIGAGATIMAGGAAVWATQRGTAEQRTADVISLLAHERDRISGEMKGKQDAVELIAIFAHLAKNTKRDLAERYTDIFKVFCSRSGGDLTKLDELDIRPHVSKALPDTAEPIRIEFTRVLEELRAAFEWESWELIDGRVRRPQAALDAMSSLWQVLDNDLIRSAETYQAAEQAIAERVLLVSRHHSAASR